jgi:glutathione synthase
MKWLVVLDPIDGLISKTDTSLAVIRQARQSGVEVDTATIDKLFFDTWSSVLATGEDGAEVDARLKDYDLIFMRKEPPYDLAFHYATQLLSLSDTLVVNSPAALRDFNEKLIALPFSRYMPPTLVSSSPSVIHNFLGRFSDCVIKSLDTFQGQAVRKITSEDSELVRQYTKEGTHPVMVQKFLDQVYEGDKRVILLGDTLLGAALRKPRKGYHANFANSEALQSPLTGRERKIVEEVGPWLLHHGIHFSGLDFIGGHLTEINITCPTGIMQISELEGRSLPQEVVNYFINLIESGK